MSDEGKKVTALSIRCSRLLSDHVLPRANHVGVRERDGHNSKRLLSPFEGGQQHPVEILAPSSHDSYL